MTYEIGTHIDLSYINKTAAPVQVSQAKETLYDPGTRIIFAEFMSSLQPVTVITPGLAQLA